MFEIKILDDKLKEKEFNPKYSTSGSVGIDLRACSFVGNEKRDSWLLYPNETLKIGTGIALNMSHEDINTIGVDLKVGAVVIPRSGLGSNSGIVLGNLVGLIDNDYQGEIIVCLWNRSNTDFQIRKYDRIAQLCFMPFIRPALKVVEEFSIITDRGAAGFGSTGKS